MQAVLHSLAVQVVVWVAVGTRAHHWGGLHIVALAAVVVLADSLVGFVALAVDSFALVVAGYSPVALAVDSFAVLVAVGLGLAGRCDHLAFLAHQL